MTHPRKAPLRLFAALVCALSVTSPAWAATVENEAGGTVHRLSPEEKAAIDAEIHERQMRGLYGYDEAEERKPHGETSIMVGTGGALGIASSIVAPVGKNATVGAAFSYERNRHRYDPYFYDPYGPYGYAPYGYAPYGVGPYGFDRGSFGGSDHFGHLNRVERMERYQHLQRMGRLHNR